MMDERQRKFHGWARGSRGDMIGQGNYGKVYMSGTSGAVVKQVKAKKSSSAAGLKLAYREHVMSLFQNALVLKRMSPHFCLHYGYEATPSSEHIAFNLFLEGFDGNLQTEATGLLHLENSVPWASLTFQIGSALVAVAVLLDVCHNDLYPRNVLIRRGDAGAWRYDILGTTYEVPLPFFAVLTDFGVCSSPILSSPAAGPEVKKSAVLDTPDNFGAAGHSGHILNFQLPPFSRDFYMLFKWLAFPPRFFPQVPKEVRRWAVSLLQQMDLKKDKFRTNKGSQWIFALAFQTLDFAQFVAEHKGLANMETFKLSSEDRGAFVAEVTSHLKAFPFAEG